MRRLSEAIHHTLREVNDEMRGEPADRVYEELVSRFGSSSSPSLTPGQDTLRRAAAQIEAGTFTG